MCYLYKLVANGRIVLLHLNVKAGIFKVTSRGLGLFQGIVAQLAWRA